MGKTNNAKVQPSVCFLFNFRFDFIINVFRLNYTKIPLNYFKVGFNNVPKLSKVLTFTIEL